jgi:hypothetical protein
MVKDKKFKYLLWFQQNTRWILLKLFLSEHFKNFG